MVNNLVVYTEFFLPSGNSIAPARTDTSGYSFMWRTDKFSARLPRGTGMVAENVTGNEGRGESGRVIPIDHLSHSNGSHVLHALLL